MPIRLCLLFVLGTGLGSFVNWGIYRLAWNPRAIGPWSRPAVGTPGRRPWDFLPVLGWFGLRRETPLWGRGFWIRPMLLELGTGAALASLYWWEIGRFGLLPASLRDLPLAGVLPVFHQEYAAHVFLFLLMMVATWIDIDERTIPDAVTVPGTLAGLALVAVWPLALLPEITLAHGGRAVLNLNCVWLSSPNQPEPWMDAAWTGWPALLLGLACLAAWCCALLPRRWYGRHGVRRAVQLLAARLVRQGSTYLLLAIAVVGSLGIVAVWWWGGPHWLGLLTGLAGMAVGGGMVWMIRVLGSAVLHREAMGFGDVTLLAMIGAVLGWQATVIIFFLAPFAGLVVGGLQWIFRGESEIPYGPFLCLATLTTIVAWGPIWERAQGVFGLSWVLLVVLAVCLSLIVVLLPLVRWGMSCLSRALGN